METGIPDVETGSGDPDHWLTYTTSTEDTMYRCLWTEEEASSPSRSLMIDLAPEDGYKGGALWAQSIQIEPGTYRGMDLNLEAAVMMKEVFGSGISMIVTTRSRSGRLLQAVTNEDSYSTPESRYWRISSLRLENLSSETRTISVILSMKSHTNGTVYFDDITLSVLK
ncbi:hypothetical protein ACFL41_00920 [Gemmatimonadota bacterium]